MNIICFIMKVDYNVFKEIVVELGIGFMFLFVNDELL